MRPSVRRPSKYPRYVQCVVDPGGTARYYFRRPGFPRVSLPGMPWSPAFMTAWEAATAALPAPIGAVRTVPGTMRALAVYYYNSVSFRSLRASSQTGYRNMIERLIREHGDKRVADLRRE